MTTIITAPTPIRRDWKIKRDADFHRTIQLMEDDRITPKNTTDYEITVVIRSGPNGTVYDTWSIGDGITHTPSQGQFDILIPYLTLRGYSFSNAQYYIQIIDDDGAAEVPFEGDIRLE